LNRITRQPQPFSEGYLDTQDGHKVYFAEYGNRAGIPILNVHGGPGLSSQAKYAGMFNLRQYRVITFDQRGCGKSVSKRMFYRNTTQHIVKDMERLRRQLGIAQWYLNGGSWGSTLALAYAVSYRNRTLGLLLASTFLGREADMRWLFGDHNSLPAKVFPETFAEYKTLLMKYGVHSASGLHKLAIVM
jgi:proline iminopeptidase